MLACYVSDKDDAQPRLRRWRRRMTFFAEEERTGARNTMWQVIWKMCFREFKVGESRLYSVLV